MGPGPCRLKGCAPNLDFPLFSVGNRQAQEEAGRGEAGRREAGRGEAVTAETGKSWSGGGTRGGEKSLGSASVAIWDRISPSPDWSGIDFAKEDSLDSDPPASACLLGLQRSTTMLVYSVLGLNPSTLGKHSAS